MAVAPCRKLSNLVGSIQSPYPYRRGSKWSSLRRLAERVRGFREDRNALRDPVPKCRVECARRHPEFASGIILSCMRTIISHKGSHEYTVKPRAARRHFQR
jgi:hypothetical protein